MRQWVSLILVVMGCGLLGYVGGQYWYMVHTQHRLEAAWQAQNNNNAKAANAATASSKGVVASPAAAAGLSDQPLIRLVIPRINLEAIVVEGTDRQQLIAGPGHLTDTAMPGDPGNAVITAHRDTFFRHIFELQKGDKITVQREGRVFEYEVTGKKVVSPNDLSVVAPTPDAQLTLITCFPIYYIGPAPDRLVVSSKLIAPESEPAGTIPAAMH
jgi:sortase A